MIKEGLHSKKKIRICGVGHRQSRGYETGKHEKPFLVPNEFLKPISDQPPVPHDPQVNREYQYKDDNDQEFKVKVLNTGPCNSRVIKVDTGQDETSFLVPNHYLEEIN